jgi:RNA polymerase-interacting CarD/CdnL/TRCF family regulator
MILTVGNKVVYPCQGPCRISSVVEKLVADTPKSFYHLAILDGSGGELFVPVDKVQDIGIRLLLKKSEIPKLLGKLMVKVELARDRRQRANDTLKRFTSGSAFDLAEVVESLTELGKTKMLTLRESWTLTRARKLLVCEISEVMGETKSAAEQQVDQALEAQKLRGIKRRPNHLPVAELGQNA